MDGSLRGLGESVLIILVLAAISFVIGAVVWAAGMLILWYGFEIWGLGPGIILALIIAAVALAGYYQSFKRVTGRIARQEEAPRSFFEIFNKAEYLSMVESLKNAPAFRISHYLLATAILLVAAVMCAIWLRPNGYLLAPVFVVFVLYLWHNRGRSMRLTAAFYNGNTLIAKDRAQDALVIARTMLKIRPRSVGGHWLMGNALFALRDYDGAQLAYETAIRYKPTSAKFLLSYVGLCAQRLGLHARALRAYEDALRLNPESREAHYGMACAYSLMNDPGHALGHLERAIELKYVDRAFIERDGDLDNIRNEPRFKEVVSNLR